VNISPLERLMRKVVKTGTCWLIPTKSRTGYVSFYLNGRHVEAHRAAYLLMVGPIPEGYHVDHSCRRHNCINPAHLEAVTPAENARRDHGAKSTNYSKTECPAKHQYTAENTLLDKSGGRSCKECARRRHREWYHRNTDEYLRRYSPAGSQRRRPRGEQTSCPSGHAMTQANTYVVPKTGRVCCRTCKREQMAAYNLARRTREAA